MRHLAPPAEWEEDSYQQLIDAEFAYVLSNRTEVKLQMDINQTFPSRWLKAADLKGKVHAVTIHSVTMEEFQDGTSKPAVWFHHREKAMILNKTNAQTIAESFGPETDTWTDKAIEIFSMRVQGPQGMVDGIRVRVPEAEPEIRDAQSGAPLRTDPGAPELDDDIPF